MKIAVYTACVVQFCLCSIKAQANLSMEIAIRILFSLGLNMECVHIGRKHKGSLLVVWECSITLSRSIIKNTFKTFIATK